MSWLNTPQLMLLERSLDVNSMRQTLVTTNLANVDTPGYHARDVDFQGELTRAAMGADVSLTSPFVLPVPGLISRPDGNNVSVDRESLLLAEVQLQFKAAAAVLRDQAKAGRGGQPYGWGRIVNIVSTAGLYGNYGQSAYASAKAGLVGLTRTIALDMARSGITCNAVAPFAATRVTESIKPANPAQETYKRHALSVPAADVAAFVAYLCSPAAQDISGQLFAVRGREVFLMSQPRPVASFVATRGDDFDTGVRAALAPHFVKLETDLEAFSSEPIV